MKNSIFDTQILPPPTGHWSYIAAEKKGASRTLVKMPAQGYYIFKLGNKQYIKDKATGEITNNNKEAVRLTIFDATALRQKFGNGDICPV